MVSVIIAGATGAIGREFVLAAVSDPAIRRIVGLSRRSFSGTTAQERKDYYAATFPGIDIEKADMKLSIVAVDWEELHTKMNLNSNEQEENSSDKENNSSRRNEGGAVGQVVASREDPLVAAFSGHSVAVMAMGTTKKDAGSAARFRHCDFDFVVAFAKLVLQLSGGTLRHFAQVSSSGADKSSWFLYMKTKGEADAEVTRLIMQHQKKQRQTPTTAVVNRADKVEDVPSNDGCCDPVTSPPPTALLLVIYRPGLLARGKEKSRTGEKILNFMLPGLPVADAGKAILQVAHTRLLPFTIAPPTTNLTTSTVSPLPTAVVYVSDYEIRGKAREWEATLPLRVEETLQKLDHEEDVTPPQAISTTTVSPEPVVVGPLPQVSHL